MIPPKVKLRFMDKLNFLLIGNITRLKATAISLPAISGGEIKKSGYKITY
jgi:hypothetical protein